MKNIFLLVILFFLSHIGYAQYACRRIDSLNRVLMILKSDSTKTKTVDTYNAFASAFAEANSKHTAAIYAQTALKIAEQIKYQKGIADALVYIALFDTKNMKGLEKTINNYQKALNIYRELGDKNRVIEIQEIIGTFYYKSENEENPEVNYKKALSNFQEAVKIRESMAEKLIVKGNKSKLAEDYEIIGELHSYLREDDKALEALTKAKAIREETGGDKLYNTRLLTKYQRIKELEDKVQNADANKIIIAFSIAIIVLGFILFVNIMRKNEAYKVLKANNIEITPKKTTSRVN